MARDSVLTLVAVAMLVGACTSSAPPTTQPSPTPVPSPAPEPDVEIVMTSVPQPGSSLLAHVFVPSSLTVSGPDTVFLLSNEPASGQELPPAHDFWLGAEPAKFIDGNWIVPPVIANSNLIGPGRSEILSVSGLAPGTYSFLCRVQGHFTGGMVGTLTVTP